MDFSFLKDYIGELVTGVVVAPVAAWIADLRSKRKIEAEVKSQELDNVEKGLSIYKDMLETVRKDMQVQHEENAKEIERLKKKLEEVTEYWKTRYNDLKRDFDNYKKEHP